MKVVKLEAIPVRIPYKRVEASSLIARGVVADVLVKVTTEDGIVGRGECTRAADVPGIEGAEPAEHPYHRADPAEWLRRTAALFRG